MNRGAGVATGVAAGYLMGRTKKMRLAMMVAAAGLSGRLAGKPGEVVRRGADQLGVSGAAKGLAGSTGGDLKSAFKSAAATLATKRIDALSERVAGGTSHVREDEDEGEDQERAEQEDRSEPEQDERAPSRDNKRGQGKSSARSAKADRAEKADESQDEGEDEESESYRPVARRRSSANEDDDDADEDQSGKAHQHSTRSSTRTRSRATTTTQRRTRR